MGKYTQKLSEAEEQAVLELMFTNPDMTARVSGIYPGIISNEQSAASGASYSRSHETFKIRILKLVESGNIVIDPGLLAKVVEHRRTWVGPMAQGMIDTWAHGSEENKGYGHKSIKNIGNLLYFVENYSSLVTNIITGHPLTNPQVQSTRYLNMATMVPRIAMSPDILASPHHETIMGTIESLSKTYEEFNKISARHMTDNQLNGEYKDFLVQHAQNDDEKKRLLKQFENAAQKTVLDSTRYLLTPAIPNSMIVSVDTGSQEGIISTLLSHPLAEARELGQTLWDETKKLAPVLLGPRAHIGVNDYAVKRTAKLDRLVAEMFPFEKSREYEVEPRTQHIPAYPEDSTDGRWVKMGTDEQMAASAAFAHGYASFIQYHEHLKNNPGDVKTILSAATEDQGKHDEWPKEFNHGGRMHESRMDKGAQRDKRRHRRGTFTEQRVSTFLGYEMPALFKEAGLEGPFAEKMAEADRTFRTIVSDNPYTAQLVVPFAFKSRTLFSWGPQQEAYYAELRSREGGHVSYRQDAWDVADQMARDMPITASSLRIDRNAYPAGLIEMEPKLKRGDKMVKFTPPKEWYRGRSK